MCVILFIYLFLNSSFLLVLTSESHFSSSLLFPVCLRHVNSWQLASSIKCHHPLYFILFLNHQTCPVLPKALSLAYCWETSVFFILPIISAEVLKGGPLEIWGGVTKLVFIIIFFFLQFYFPPLHVDVNFSS